jgi:hypothetical protein
LNHDLLSNPSKFLTTRAQQLISKFNDKVSQEKNKAENEILGEFFMVVRNFISTLGKPTFKKRKVYDNTPPFSGDLNNTFSEVYNDTRLISDEQTLALESFKQSFNYTATEKFRLKNQINNIQEKVNDYIVLAQNTISKCYVIQDSFGNDSKADLSWVGNPANLDTDSGIVTLGIQGSINRSIDALIKSGDVFGQPSASMPGNFLVAYRAEQPEEARYNQIAGVGSGQEWDLLCKQDSHNDLKAILDDTPDTWYEYQMINVREELKRPGASPNTRGWGWYYDDGTPIYYGNPATDELTITVLIRLKEKTTINWIDITPYLPTDACYIRVDEIQTSLTNSNDYVTCLDENNRGSFIGTATNLSSLTTKNRQAFRDHGVFIFPAREAAYVRISLAAPKSYTCPIAHIYWEAQYDVVKKSKFLGFTVSSSTKHVVERIEGPKLRHGSFNDYNSLIASPETIAGVSLLAGLAFGVWGVAVVAIVALWDFLFGTEKKIKNYTTRSMLDIYPDGFRWCIGLRGVDINSYTYAPSSTYVTKDFHLNFAVNTISLSVSEFIPEEFYKDDYLTKNNWIKYSISVDSGVTWYAISPLERTPVADEEFPPKVLTVTNTSPTSDLTNKGYIKTSEDVKKIKLMAELLRPEGMETLTPYIDNFKIKILSKTEEIQ